jgi:hypothetical protein
MDKKRNRPSMKEINAEMDAIIKRNPTPKQIEELAEIIETLNEESRDDDRG